MSKEYWNRACKDAINGPHKQVATIFGAVVSAAFAICAVVGGCLFVRWWRLDSQHRLRIWKLYGWFTGIVCVGSCAGAVSYAAWAQWLYNYYLSPRPTPFTNSTLENGPEDIESAVFYGKSFQWLIAVAITYPAQFSCIFAAYLLVLDRMIDFALPGAEGTARRWRFFGRVLLAISSVGSVVGFCTNIGASVIFERSAQDFFSAQTTKSVSRARQDALDRATGGMRLYSIFLGFETVVLLLSVAAFSVAGTVSSLRIRLALRSARAEIDSAMNTSLRNTSLSPVEFKKSDTFERAVATGQQLNRQIVTTCAVVFLSFLLRAVLSTMMALASVLQQSNAACPGFVDRCSSCYNVYSLMLVFLLHTPEFFFTVILASQPATLLVALWGMTSGHTLAVLNARGA